MMWVLLLQVPALMSTRTVSLLLSLVIGLNFLASCTLAEDARVEGVKTHFDRAIRER